MFLRWWTFTVVTTGLFFVGEYFMGIVEYILINDMTYLSSAILGIYLYVSAWIGTRAYRVDREHYFFKSETKKYWFLAESCMGLGMIGTLVGFLIILSTAFSDIDVTSTESMRQVIGNLASGMGTALVTSLVGLSLSILLKYQLVSLESANEGL